MDNWLLYKSIHIAANKDMGSNWFPPDQFEIELVLNNIRLMRDKFGFPETYVPGTFHSGSGASRVIDTDLLPFQEIKEYALNEKNETNISNWYYIDDFFSEKSIFPEIISKQSLGTRVNSPIRKATDEYPFAILIEKGLRVWPSTTKKINVVYYRRPRDPVFKTKVNTITGFIEYDPVGSVDLEWKDESKIDIIHFILQDVGVSIEKSDLQQLAYKLTSQGK